MEKGNEATKAVLICIQIRKLRKPHRKKGQKQKEKRRKKGQKGKQKRETAGNLALKKKKKHGMILADRAAMKGKRRGRATDTVLSVYLRKERVKQPKKKLKKMRKPRNSGWEKEGSRMRGKKSKKNEQKMKKTTRKEQHNNKTTDQDLRSDPSADLTRVSGEPLQKRRDFSGLFLVTPPISSYFFAFFQKFIFSKEK